MIGRIRAAVAATRNFVSDFREFVADVGAEPPAAVVEAFLVGEVRKRPIAGTTTRELADAAEAALPAGRFGVSAGTVQVALLRLERRGEIHCRPERDDRRATRRWFPRGGTRSRNRGRTPAAAPSPAR